MVDARAVQTIRLKYNSALFIHVTDMEPRYSPSGVVGMDFASLDRFLFRVTPECHL